ncbi:MAG: hypothetical protein MMC33_005684 [Icmadophila ericetorum]|nr:hypothetical protein [Icmadophila ericetorum]
METILSEDGLPHIQTRRAESLPLPQNGTFSEEPSNCNLHRNYQSPTSLPQPTLLHPQTLDPVSRKSSPSQRSSPSSQYLSPPLTDSDGETPPFKPAANDYVSLDQHGKSKKKKKCRPLPVEGIYKTPRRSRSLRNSPLDSIEETEKDFPALPVLSWKHQHEDWRISKIGPRNASLASGPSEDDVRKIWEKLQRGGFPCRQLDMNTPSKYNLYASEVEQIAKAIRKKRRRRHSLIPPSVATPAAAVVTLDSSVSPVLPSVRDGSNSAIQQKVTVHRKEKAYQMSSQGKESENQGHPATITLRRATLIQTLMTEVSPNTETGSIMPDIPEATLCEASRDTPGLDSVFTSPSSKHDDAQLASPSYFPPTLIKLETSNAKRSSLPADLALTFVEVRTAPVTFSVNQESRKSPQSTSTSSGDTSTVRIQSDSSVHEIIWDHDDTSSSRSSTGDALAKACSYPLGDAGDHESQASALQYTKSLVSRRSKPPSGDLSTIEPDAFTDVLPVESQPIFPPTPEPGSRVVSWAWSASDETPSKSKRRRKSYNPSRSFPSSHRASRMSVPPTAPHSVESFPPLLDRQTTADWINPLREMNDPTSTFLHEASLTEKRQETNLTAGHRLFQGHLATLEDVAEVESPPLDSLSDAGKVGSGLGKSSHVRKSSVVGQRRLTASRLSIPSGSSKGLVIGRRSSAAQLKAYFFDPLVSLISKREARSAEAIPNYAQVQAQDADSLILGS